jgi:uncharacterized protein DUF6159
MVPSDACRPDAMVLEGDMAGKIRRSWAMAMASWSVLERYPGLMILPVISASALVAALLLMGGFIIEAGGFTQAGELVRRFDHYWDTHSTIAIVAMVAAGWVLTTVSIYFNSALVFCVMRCFAGHRPSIRDGLTAAVARLPQIVGWAFVATVVGTVIAMVQDLLKERLGFLGSLVGGLFDIAWAAVTYFVLPVLVVEGSGPVTSVKRSSALLRQTWGEAVVNNVGLAAFGMVAALPAVAMIVVGVALAIATGNGAMAAVLFGTALLYLVVMSVMLSTLGTILQTGLYVYATTGRAPFDEALVRDAFQPKSAK